MSPFIFAQNKSRNEKHPIHTVPIHLHLLANRLIHTTEDTITTKSTLDYFAIDIFPSRIQQSLKVSGTLLSQHISIITANQSHPIIITDITSEISDADNATNALKFKYKYARHRIPKSLKYPNNIFGAPFHRTFD